MSSATGTVRKLPTSPDRSAPPRTEATPSLRAPEVQRFALSNGLPVLLVEKHDLPLVAVEILLPGGAGAVAPSRAGLAGLTADMLDEGAGKRSALDIATELERLGALLGTSAGYDDFWIEGGLIIRQRSVLHPLSFQAEEEGENDVVIPGTATRPSRQYPAQPIVGVGAVIIRDGQVVLVKRRFEPLAGQWSLPGGRLELGETLESGLAREMREETGLEVQVGPVVDVFDRILLDPERRVRYHYVLIDYLCRPIGGSLTHGSDVAAAEFVDPSDLKRFRLTPKATSVIEKALVAARHHQWEQAGR